MSKIIRESNKEMIMETKSKHTNMKLQTNRYKFTSEITNLLSEFAKMHQHEGSKEYKESWNKWIIEPEVRHELEEEKSRLIKEGIVGDVMDRLYKS